MQIGSVERDIQVTVITCSNIIPTLDRHQRYQQLRDDDLRGRTNLLRCVLRPTWTPARTLRDLGLCDPRRRFHRAPRAARDRNVLLDADPGGCDVIPVLLHRHGTRRQLSVHRFPDLFLLHHPLRGLDVDAGPDANVVCNSFTTLTASATAAVFIPINGIPARRPRPSPPAPV